MIGNVIFNVSLIFVLLIIAAIFSAVETGFTAYSVTKIHKIPDPEKAKVISKLIKNKDTVISTFLILYSVINTITTIIATSFFIDLYGPNLGTIIASLVMTVLIVTFAEVIPKAISVSKSETVVENTYIIADYMVWLFTPLNYCLSLSVKIFCKVFRINLINKFSPADEMKSIIQYHHHEGYVYKEDKDMLDGVLDLNNIHVVDIMIHRSQMSSINIELPLNEIIKKVINSNFNNLPIWKGTKDNIIGVLNVKQLVRQILNDNGSIKDINDIYKYVKEPYFIPYSVTLNMQLKEFKRNNHRIGFVLDEYGDIQGLVTVFDIVEEITGLLNSQRQQILKKSFNLFLIDGSTTIRDINRYLDWNLSEKSISNCKSINTIGGLIINHLGRIPDQNETFYLNQNLKITIKKKYNNKIKLVEVRVIQDDLALIS